MRTTRLAALLLPILFAGGCDACGGVTSPAPHDPGTVIVRVTSASGAPISGVWVYIELPNSIGSTFWKGSATNSDGTVTHRDIPAGLRMLEVKPPTGYATDTPKQEIEVVKERTTTAQFTLHRLTQ